MKLSKTPTFGRGDAPQSEKNPGARSPPRARSGPSRTAEPGGQPYAPRALRVRSLHPRRSRPHERRHPRRRRRRARRRHPLGGLRPPRHGLRRAAAGRAGRHRRAASGAAARSTPPSPSTPASGSWSRPPTASAATCSPSSGTRRRRSSHGLNACGPRAAGADRRARSRPRPDGTIPLYSPYSWTRAGLRRRLVRAARALRQAADGARCSRRPSATPRRASRCRR